MKGADGGEQERQKVFECVCLALVGREKSAWLWLALVLLVSPPLFQMQLEELGTRNDSVRAERT